MNLIFLCLLLREFLLFCLENFTLLSRTFRRSISFGFIGISRKASFVKFDGRLGLSLKATDLNFLLLSNKSKGRDFKLLPLSTTFRSCINSWKTNFGSDVKRLLFSCKNFSFLHPTNWSPCNDVILLLSRRKSIRLWFVRNTFIGR